MKTIRCAVCRHTVIVVSNKTAEYIAFFECNKCRKDYIKDLGVSNA